jgi:phosphate transport system protein
MAMESIVAPASFYQGMQELQDNLTGLGNLVDQAIVRAVEALKNRDLAASRQVIQGDDLIDLKRYQLEEGCIYLMGMQQPLATDLRTLVAILHVSVELERIGDYAEGIAKISLMMADEPPLKPLIDIPRMAELASNMLRRSLNALDQAMLISGDEAAAEAAALQVCTDDDEVDALYDQVYRELLTYMLQDPKTVQRATYLLWVAHNLERMADRATNIAERVIFLITGKLTRMNASRY